MVAYIDTSVLLRIILTEKNRYTELSSHETLYSSVLLRTEAYRTLYRIRLENGLNDEEASVVFSKLLKFLAMISLVPITPNILREAEQFFPTSVATLDAIHLTSALAVQRRFPEVNRFLTHDSQLGRAAQAMGLKVAG